jgi:hypothetical protein
VTPLDQDIKALDNDEVKGIGASIANVSFDPKAFDGDGDGKVQDNTSFERPTVPFVMNSHTGLMSVSGDYSASSYKDMTVEQMVEHAVPDSPEKFVKALLDMRTTSDIKTDTGTFLQGFDKALREGLGTSEAFDFSPEAIKSVRVALGNALRDHPAFAEAVRDFGLPPIVRMQPGMMESDEAGGYEWMYHFMMFNPPALEEGGMYAHVKNFSNEVRRGIGAKGTTRKLIGVDTASTFTHEFGHYVNDMAAHHLTERSGNDLAMVYANLAWGDMQDARPWISDPDALHLVDSDIEKVIKKGKETPDGLPFINSQYGQSSPAEMFAEAVNAVLSSDKNNNESINATLKAHVMKVLGKDYATYHVSPEKEERIPFGLKSEGPRVPTGEGNVHMPATMISNVFDVIREGDTDVQMEHRDIFGGHRPTSIDWLKDASDEEIATLVTPMSAMDHAVMIIQQSHIHDFDTLSKAQINSEIATILRYLVGEHSEYSVRSGIDYEAREQAREEVINALKNKPFAWYVRTYGFPPITIVTPESEKRARESSLGPLMDNLSGVDDNGEKVGYVGAWFSQLGGELTTGIVINRTHHQVGKEAQEGDIGHRHAFSTSDGKISNIVNNVSMSRESTIRHEWGHYLYWRLTRHSSDETLNALGVDKEKAQEQRDYLRKLYDINKGMSLGPPNVTRDFWGQSANGMYNPSVFEQLRNQGFPIVNSVYGQHNPQENFAESFAAFTSEYPRVRSYFLDRNIRNIMAQVTGIDTDIVDDKGKPSHDKPWERNVSGLASRSATIMGKDFGQISKELELTDKEVSIAEDELTHNMDEVTSGELAKRPIHSAIEKDKKRLLDSIRVEVDDDGIPMMMADPNPLMFQFIPDKRDWSKVRVPKRATVKAAAKHIKENQSEAIFNDEDTKQSLFGRNYERLEERFSNRLIGLVESLTEGAPKEDIGDSVGSGWLSLYLSGLSNPVRSSFADGSGSVESGVHDTFGHAGIGRGFDRHGEWANPLAVITMLDNPIFDDFTPDEKEAVKRSVLTRFAMSRIEQTYGTGFGDKYDEDMDGGQWNNWIYGYTGDIQTVIDMLDDSDRTQVLNNDGSPISGLRSGKPLNGVTRTDVQAVAKQDAIHTHGLASEKTAIEVIDALVKDPSLYDLAPEKIPEVIFKLAGGDPELFSRLRNRNVTPQGMWTEERIRELVNQIRIEPSPDGIFTMIAPPVPEFQKIIGFDGDFSHVRIPSSEARIRMYQSILDNLREPKPGLGYTDYSETFGEKLSDAADSLLIPRSAYRNLRESLGAEYTPGGPMDSFDTLYERFLRVPSDAMMLEEQDQGSFIQVMHDIIGHLGTGRGFDRHGEWANFLAMVHTSQNIYADNPEYKDALPFDLFRRIMIMQLRTWEQADEMRGISTAKEALGLLEKIHKASDNMTIDVETMRQILQLDNPDTYSPVQNKSLLQEPPKTRATAYIHSLIDNNITETRKAHSSFVGYIRGKPIKQPDTKTLPWVDISIKSFVHSAPKHVNLSFTKPQLHSKLYKEVLNGTDGGPAGTWTAKKALLLTRKYEEQGGSYRGGVRKMERSLRRWTRETTTGKIRNGNLRRYLPADAWSRRTLSPPKSTGSRTSIGHNGNNPKTSASRARTTGRNVRSYRR